MSHLIVDLSSIFAKHWHAHGKNGRRGETTQSTVGSVLSLADEYGGDEFFGSGTSVCCDVLGAKCWRHEIFPEYKSGRDPWPQDALDEYEQCKAQLSAKGCRVRASVGFEADDIIATLCYQAGNRSIVIASSDKDLLQLIGMYGNDVRVYRKHKLYGWQDVYEEFRVRPSQMLDFLCMTGDSSDGVPGIRGIGEVKAAKILHRWGTLRAAFAACTAGTAAEVKLKPSTYKSLSEGMAGAELARRLLTLRTDVPIGGAE